MGGLRHRHARAGGGRRDHLLRHAAQRPPADGGRGRVRPEAGRRRSAPRCVDFALWGGLVPGNVGALDELAERGVVGFKAFMSEQRHRRLPGGRRPDAVRGDGARRRGSGCLVAVHAESDAITTGLLARRAVRPGRTGVRDYLASRPVVAELEAIARAILLCRGDRLRAAYRPCQHRARRGAGGRRRGRAGVDVSCETCPHYLVLTEEDVERARRGRQVRAAAALAGRAARRCGSALADGTLPMVASDHSPAPAEHEDRRRLLRASGAASPAASRCWRCC